MLHKIIIYWLVIFILPSSALKEKNHYKSITYSIRPDINDKRLYINAKYTGAFSGKIVMKLPDVWAGHDYSQQIHNITLTNKEDKLLIKKNAQKQFIIDLPRPSDEIEIDYEVSTAALEDRFGSGKLIFYNDFIHSPGLAIFIFPENISKADISVIWQQTPKGWSTTSSHRDGHSLKFAATIDELLHSIFIVGKIRKYKRIIDGKIIHFSFYGDFDFTDQEMVNQATKIVKSQRGYFDDNKFDNYLISLIENPDGTKNLALMDGANFHNSFVASMTKNISYEQFKILFAHEHLHNWIGRKIKNSEEELNYWWSEGFTDYYSRLLAIRYKILSFDEFVIEVNNLLKEYYKSPVQNLPNHEIKRLFWKKREVQRLPYIRGFIFALSLNCKLKSLNSNFSTDLILDNFIKHQDDIYFSNKKFIKALREMDVNTDDLESYFENHIIEGKQISLCHCQEHLPLKEKPCPNSVSHQQTCLYLKTNLENKAKNQLTNFFDLK